ncbi:MAG: diphosphomevalonate decarboxylase, partial [Pseudoclavibacter sp.]
DASSHAEPVEAPDMRMVIVTVSRAMKQVSSREAMRRTALTSPFHAAWVADTGRALESMLAACRDGDFTRIGRITESNALRMHAVIQAADPPIRYLTPESIAVFDAVQRLRADGLEAYATADAGPNVVALTTPAHADEVAARLAPLGDTTIAGPGPGAALVAGGGL